jgi:hypothetical protein
MIDDLGAGQVDGAEVDPDASLGEQRRLGAVGRRLPQAQSHPQRLAGPHHVHGLDDGGRRLLVEPLPTGRGVADVGHRRAPRAEHAHERVGGRHVPASLDVPVLGVDARRAREVAQRLQLFVAGRHHADPVTTRRIPSSGMAAQWGRWPSS